MYILLLLCQYAQYFCGCLVYYSYSKSAFLIVQWRIEQKQGPILSEPAGVINSFLHLHSILAFFEKMEMKIIY